MKQDHTNINCNNCGKRGHVFRNCTSPRTSIGIILFMNYENEMRLLQVQRKDTIGFIDFIRGKFRLDDTQYMKKLLSIMTKNEQKTLMNTKFEDLWSIIWFDNSEKNIQKYKKSFEYSKSKFKKMQNGINMGQNTKISLEEFIASSESKYTETEWGFPKGRRERDETNKECACREVYEETGLRQNIDYEFHGSINPITVEFKGLDNYLYRHIFYVGEVKDQHKINIKINKNNKFQLSELKDIKWHSLATILSTARSYNYGYFKEIIKKFDTILKGNKNI